MTENLNQAELYKNLNELIKLEGIVAEKKEGEPEVLSYYRVINALKKVYSLEDVKNYHKWIKENKTIDVGETYLPEELFKKLEDSQEQEDLKKVYSLVELKAYHEWFKEYKEEGEDEVELDEETKIKILRKLENICSPDSYQIIAEIFEDL